MTEQISALMETYVLRFVVALAALVIGGVLAWLAARIVHTALQRTGVAARVAAWFQGPAKTEESAEAPEVDYWISRGVFYLIIVVAVGAFFQIIGLTVITDPIQTFLREIFEYAPRLIGPAILVVVAWLVATALRFVVRRIAGRMRLEQIGEQAGLPTTPTLAQTLGDTVYWLTFLLFLPAILHGLDLGGLLEPVQSMIDKVLGFLPNMLAAAVILFVGWLVARIIQRLVTNLLAAVGTDALADRVGVVKALGQTKLSALIGLVVYVLILIPVLIAGLNALRLEAITNPASAMLNAILAAIPSIFAAVLVLAIAYLVARVVSGMTSNVLNAAGFDNILERLGLGGVPAEGARSPSEVAGYLVLVGIMLFATIEALNLLGFATLATLVSEFLVFVGQVLLGLIIFAVGLYLANLVSRTIEATSAPQGALLALVSRVAILVLAGAIGLRHMGLANEIVTVAFALLFGAIAVAAAIAFGIGGKDAAADAVSKWQTTLTSGDSRRREKK